MAKHTLPPIDWYRSPELTELTPLTVTADGRVLGHVAGWETAHISFPGKRITPPRSRTDYAMFHTGAMQVQDGNEAREISVGRLLMSCPHAGTELGHQATHDFYANSGSVAATVCAHEDQFGIAIAGAVEPGLDDLALRRFRSCGLSGDWRNVNGNLEMVGVISVGVQGFPIPRARVASGAPLALVAAGFVPPATRFGKRVADGWSAQRSAADVATLNASKLTAGLGLDDFADAIAARLDARREAGELSARHTALVSELDDTPAVVAALLAEVDDSPQRAAELFAELNDGGSEADNAFGTDA